LLADRDPPKIEHTEHPWNEDVPAPKVREARFSDLSFMMRRSFLGPEQVNVEEERLSSKASTVSLE
jgi:hypothetical protein